MAAKPSPTNGFYEFTESTRRNWPQITLAAAILVGAGIMGSRLGSVETSIGTLTLKVESVDKRLQQVHVDVEILKARTRD